MEVIILGRKQKQKRSTRDLIGINEITDYSLKNPIWRTSIFYNSSINISVLLDESASVRIYARMTVLKGISEIEMLYLIQRKTLMIISSI